MAQGQEVRVDHLELRLWVQIVLILNLGLATHLLSNLEHVI